MKTLFLYVNSEFENFFFEKEGDYSHLNNYIVDVDIQDYDNPEYYEEINSIVEDALNNKIEILSAPSRDYDFFVKVFWVL